MSKWEGDWFRWFLYGTSSVIVWCPLCLCLRGVGVGWVSACTVGLISVVVVSGYSTWSLLHRLLYCDDDTGFPSLTCHLERWLKVRDPEELSQLASSTSRCHDTEFLSQEIGKTAIAMHGYLVLPWYECVSPDMQTSYQIRDVLEEMLMCIQRKLQEIDGVAFATEIVHLYLQHYKQYHKALNKVSKLHGCSDPSKIRAFDEIESFYSPLHPAIRSPEGHSAYYQKLSQALLEHYLPNEVLHCDLLTVFLRDLIERNVLQALITQLTDTRWLYMVLIDLISQIDSTKGVKKCVDESNVEKCEKFSSSLSVIEEETKDGIEMSNLIISNGTALKYEDTTSNMLIQSAAKFQSAEALVDYVKQASYELPCAVSTDDRRSVSSALGCMISATVGPLMSTSNPEVGQCRPILTKLWESPVEEKVCCFPNQQHGLLKKKNRRSPFDDAVVEGLKEEDFKRMVDTRPCDHSFTRQHLSITPNARLNAELNVPKQHLTKSKSCESLIGEIENHLSVESVKCFHSSLTIIVTGSQTSVMSEWSILGDNNHNREKGCLVKMDSFDKSDGADEVVLLVDPPNVMRPIAASTNFPDCDLHIASSQPVDIRPAIDCSSKDPAIDTPICPVLGITSSNTGSVRPNSPSGTGQQLSKMSSGDSTENPADLSPIYEESEGLAASIAKLRSLLTEKEVGPNRLGSLSSFGSSDSEPKSAQSDPGRYCLEKSLFSFAHKDSSSSLVSIKSVSSIDSAFNAVTDEELPEAAEIPLDGRVFLSISIPSHEVQSEGEGGPGGGQFTVYLVQYDAIYLCEVAASESGRDSGVVDPKMVLQTNCVRRRFREFLTLHAALEEDIKLRGAMKGIKGPNKWLNLPFSKLDSTTISSRRQFLEKYLQAIVMRPEINVSMPMKEFLSYGCNSSVTFVKKPVEINMTRLDKFFARTVSGVFHSIKTALPSFDSTESGSSGGTSGSVASVDGVLGLKGIGGGMGLDKKQMIGGIGGRIEFQLRLDVTAEDQECEMEEMLIRAISNNSPQSSQIDSAYEVRESQNFFSLNSFRKPNTSLREGLLRHHRNLDYVYSPSKSPILKHCLLNDNIDEEFPDSDLAVALLELCATVLTSSDSAFTHQPCMDFFIKFLAPMIQERLMVELKQLFSADRVGQYIRSLREILLSHNKSVSQPSNVDLEILKCQLQSAILDMVPGSVSFLLGDFLMKWTVSCVIDSVSHPVVTKDLACHIVDLIACQLLPSAGS